MGMTTTGNKRDRARLAALNDADQRIASYTAEKLYDGTRTVARCWSLALDALDVLDDDWRP
jgi:hypothetical protein